MTSTHRLLLAITLLLSSVGSITAFHISQATSRQPRTNASTQEALESTLQPTRRQFTQSLIASSFLAYLSPATAVSIKLEPYTDSEYGFRLSVPSEWKKTTQTLSGRRKATFFTQESEQIDTLMYIAYTPIRDDFTSLASFGSVDAVAQATILPKGELGGTSDESKMLSAESKKNAYYFDYTSTPVVAVEAGSGSGAMTRQLSPVHFRTIFTLLPLKSGAGSTLVTITLQTNEEKYAVLKGVFDEIVDSFERA